MHRKWLFQSLNFFPVDTTLGLCAAESFGGGHVKKWVSFRSKTGEFQISTKQLFCVIALWKKIFSSIYTSDVTVFIGPSVCSKTGQDLNVCVAGTEGVLWINVHVVQKSPCLNWMEQHISSPTHSKRLYLSFTQSRHVLLETVLNSDISQNYSPANPDRYM